MKGEKRKPDRGRKPKLFKLQLSDINNDLLKWYTYKGGAGARTYFRKDDLIFVFERERGACRECGIKIALRGTTGQKAKFIFRRPMSKGGHVTRDNLMLCCNKCKTERRPMAQKPIKRIPEVDTIADLIERLVIEVKEENTEAVQLLKRNLNFALMEAMETLYYKPLFNYKDHEPVFFVEEKNTIADTVEQIAEAVVEEKEEEVKEKKEELRDSLDSITKEQKYKIMVS